MASAKDTFEAGTFLANSFACGTWRGVGVDVAPLSGGSPSAMRRAPAVTTSTLRRSSSSVDSHLRRGPSQDGSTIRRSPNSQL
jgi:hypothetical protein